MAELRSYVDQDARAVRVLCDEMPPAVRHRVLAAIQRTTPRIERQSLYALFAYIFEDDSDSDSSSDSDAAAHVQGQGQSQSQQQESSGEDLLKVNLSVCLLASF